MINDCKRNVPKKLEKQAGNGPSRRPAQSANRVNCYNYAERHYCEAFVRVYSGKRFENIFSPNQNKSKKSCERKKTIFSAEELSGVLYAHKCPLYVCKKSKGASVEERRKNSIVPNKDLKGEPSFLLFIHFAARFDPTHSCF